MICWPALKGKIEVIEVVPPAVQTTLTPGQGSRQPLEQFIEEVMALLTGQPTPSEILVERVRFQRFAEAEHRFEETLESLNEFANRSSHRPRCLLDRKSTRLNSSH